MPTTTPTKDALEIRLNSLADARAAVQNFIPLQRETTQRGYDRIVFVIEKSLSRDIHATLATFFRKVKTSYVYVEAPPNRELFPLPHFNTNGTLPAGVADVPPPGVPISGPITGPLPPSADAAPKKKSHKKKLQPAKEAAAV